MVFMEIWICRSIRKAHYSKGNKAKVDLFTFWIRGLFTSAKLHDKLLWHIGGVECVYTSQLNGTVICVFGLCQFIKAIFIHQNHNRSEDQKEMTVQFFQWPLRLEQSEHLKINRWKKERIEFPNFLATQCIELPAFMSDCQPKNTKSKRKAVNKTT